MHEQKEQMKPLFANLDDGDSKAGGGDRRCVNSDKCIKVGDGSGEWDLMIQINLAELVHLVLKLPQVLWNS